MGTKKRRKGGEGGGGNDGNKQLEVWAGASQKRGTSDNNRGKY